MADPSDNTEVKHRNLIPFEPGQSGNPAGRPKGARNKLGEAFIEALHDDFNEHGVAAIQVVRAEKPDQYLKVIASLLPKDVNFNVNNEIEMSDDELLERIRYLSEAFTPLLAGVGNAGEGTGEATGEGQPARLH